MSLVSKGDPTSEAEPKPGSPEDPFRLGWRYVQRTLADGEVEYDQIPLTLEDLLFPEEYDHAMNHPAHAEDCFYLYGCLKILMAEIPRSLVLVDCRVDFDIPGVRPLGPDVAVFLDAPEGWSAATLYVGQFDVRPVLVVEVTSPDTRPQDFDRKMDFYDRGRVPCYVIVDSEYHQGVRHNVRLVGFRHAPDGYEPIPLDDQGRLFVEPLNLWLTIEDDRVRLINGQDGRLIDTPVDLYRTREIAQAEAQTAKVEAEIANAQAQTAQAKVQTLEAEVQIANAQAQTAQAKVQTLEAEVQIARAETQTAQAKVQTAQAEARAARAEARTAQAETQTAQAEARAARAEARTAQVKVEIAEARVEIAQVKVEIAEVRAKTESDARLAAEVRAKTESDARLGVEAQLAALQAELRRLKGEG